MFGTEIPWAQRKEWLVNHRLWQDRDEGRMAARFAQLGEVTFSDARAGSELMA